MDSQPEVYQRKRKVGGIMLDKPPVRASLVDTTSNPGKGQKYLHTRTQGWPFPGLIT